MFLSNDSPTWLASACGGSQLEFVCDSVTALFERQSPGGWVYIFCNGDSSFFRYELEDGRLFSGVLAGQATSLGT